MKKLSEKRKRQLRNLALLFAIVLSVSALVFGILCWSGVIYFEDGMHFSTEMFDGLRGSFWAYPVFIAIQIVITILLCFVPGTSAAMIGIAVALWGSTWQTFITCFVGVILSSIGMDLVGRFGGSRAVIRLVGQEDYDEATRLVSEKGYTYLPFMYLLPLFPDDALCMCAGLARMNFWYHLLIIILFRGIGIATIVFGIGIIPYQEWLPFFDHIYDWFVCIGVTIAYIMALLKISRIIDKKVTAWLEKRRNANQ